MPTKLQQQLTALHHALANQPTPGSYDETYRLAAAALRQILGKVQVLFYMVSLPPECESLSMVRCSARQLDPDLFVHDSLSQWQHFSFETHHPHCTPITLAGHNFGFLFLERIAEPLTEIEQQLVALLVTQVAHHLGHLSQQIGSSKNGPLQVRIDEHDRQVWIKNSLLTLGPTEMDVFKILYQHRGHLCSRDLICRTVYQDEVDITKCREKHLHLLIFKLRKRLSEIDNNPVSIKTVRAIGYRLELI